MKKPIMVQPQAVNALAPLFLKNLFYVSLIGLLGFVMFFFTFSMGLLKSIIFSLIVIFFINFLVTLYHFIILYNTKYFFYEDRITKEFELFNINSESVPYSAISNIELAVSLWDRITNCGDVLIHVPDDSIPDIKLNYIQTPEKIEKFIYKMKRKKSK